MVLDLDPPEGKFDLAVEMAFVMKEVLGEVGLSGAAKTSGAKGVHLYVPLRRGATFPTVRELAGRLGRRAEAREPTKSTTEIAKAGRAGRVFIDTNRNAGGAAFYPALNSRVLWGRPQSFVGPFIMPQSTRQFGFVHPGSNKMYQNTVF